MITHDGASDYPWGCKDETGRMILVRERGGSVVAWSRDEGGTWEEV